MAKAKRARKPVKKVKAAVKKAAPRVTKKPPAAPKKAEPAGPARGASGVEVGKAAPRFALKDQRGAVVGSDSLKGAPYVLYFYPKDDTSGCTREACAFRDTERSFGKVRARVLGVSPDSEQSHAKFAAKYGLPFTLLADPDKVLAKAYGAWALKKNYGREYMGIVRSTFVVDAQGIVKKAFRSVKVDGHVDAVLAAVQAL